MGRGVSKLALLGGVATAAAGVAVAIALRRRSVDSRTLTEEDKSPRHRPETWPPSPQSEASRAQKQEGLRLGRPDWRSRLQLCPQLVVPSNEEFMFVLPEKLQPKKQDLDFNIVDPRGKPLIRVIVREMGGAIEGGHPPSPSASSVALQNFDTREPHAIVSTVALHTGSGPPTVLRPSGDLFGSVETCSSDSYMIRQRAGQRLLIFRVFGADKAVEVTNPNGRIVASIEGCKSKGTEGPVRTGRVDHEVDAGLVLSGMLALAKLGATT